MTLFSLTCSSTLTGNKTMEPSFPEPVVIDTVKPFKADYAIRTIDFPDSIFKDSFYIHCADTISKAFAHVTFPEIIHCSDENTPLRNDCQAEYMSALKIVSFSITTLQRKTWRSDGPGYARPIQYRAVVECELSVISMKDTSVIKRVTSKAVTKQPFLYTFFKKYVKNKDIIKYASHPYAPPPLRALFKSIEKAYEKI